jgi:hypothetical protein
MFAGMISGCTSLSEQLRKHFKLEPIQISDSYVDYMMTLYCLRRWNGRPPDDIWYMYYTGRRKGIQYVYITYSMGRVIISLSNIGYWISDRI